MYRKIIIKIAGVVLVLLVLNVIYTRFLYPADLKEKYPESYDIINTQQLTDIYYFGESSNITYDPADSVRSTIAELTNLFYPSLKITTINKPATHLGIYKEWLKELDPTKKMPKAVVLTLNVRSFDAAWIHSKLETALRESLVLRKPFPPIVNRFMLSLQAFDNKTEQQREQDMLEEWRTKQLRFPFPFKYRTVAEWDQAMSQGHYTKPDGTWDVAKITLACHYIKSYAFNLDDSNPRVNDLDEIKRWCDQKKLPLYLNLMAENVQYADSLVGKELVFLMKQNRDYLVNRYQGNNCTVVDNFISVEGKEFIDQDWTTEHYKYKGRMIVARNLADSLKKQFNNSYKKAY